MKDRLSEIRERLKGKRISSTTHFMLDVYYLLSELDRRDKMLEVAERTLSRCPDPVACQEALSRLRAMREEK